jgi:hypothetical protein
MSTRTASRLLTSFAVILLSAPACSADTILYSNLGDGFRASRAWVTHGFDPDQGGDLQISIAMPFAIPDGRVATVRSIELGLEFDPTGEDFVQIDVFKALDGRPGPSVALAGHDLPFFSTPDRLLTIQTNFQLQPSDYFLGIRTSGDIRTVWFQTTAPFFGGWRSVNDGPWVADPLEPQGAFRLSGAFAPTPAATPEPASIVLLTSGIAGLLSVRRRRVRRTSSC